MHLYTNDAVSNWLASELWHLVSTEEAVKCPNMWTMQAELP